MKYFYIPLFFLFMTLTSFAQSTTDTLLPQLDNSMYSENSNRSNGVGVHLFAGRTFGSNNRRALIKFDVSAIPVDATITTADLMVSCNKSQGTSTIFVHEVFTPWGEGNSNAGGTSGGQGAPAQPGDATWTFNIWNTDSWTTVGGDFDPNVSASASSTAGQTSTFSSTDLTADIQGWVSGNSDNHGWILKTNEVTAGRANRFDSRESSNSPPNLIITYEVSNPCFDVDTLSGNLGSAIYSFSNAVYSDGFVLADSNVVINAFNAVELANEFEVFLQGELLITVDSCQ